MLARHDWRLVDRLELARRGAGHVRAGEADTARRGVILAYSLALHHACSGADGPGAQNAGYAELHRYLYEVARWRYADVCEEAAQSALVHTFTSFARCIQPGAFLAFALQQLLNAARTARRQRDRSGRLSGSDRLDSSAAEEDDRPGTDPAAAAVLGELRERFARLADAFLKRHPRAKRQLAALKMKYLDGLDEQTIGLALDVPARSLYVLRSRAVAKLRAEPEWYALAAEFGIVAPAPEVQDSPPARTFDHEKRPDRLAR